MKKYARILFHDVQYWYEDNESKELAEDSRERIVYISLSRNKGITLTTEQYTRGMIELENEMEELFNSKAEKLILEYEKENNH